MRPLTPDDALKRIAWDRYVASVPKPTGSQAQVKMEHIRHVHERLPYAVLRHVGLCMGAHISGRGACRALALCSVLAFQPHPEWSRMDP